MVMGEYKCGTCGAQGVVLEGKPGLNWEVRCSRGHLLVPIPGTLLVSGTQVIIPAVAYGQN